MVSTTRVVAPRECFHLIRKESKQTNKQNHFALTHLKGLLSSTPGAHSVGTALSQNQLAKTSVEGIRKNCTVFLFVCFAFLPSVIIFCE